MKGIIDNIDFNNMEYIANIIDRTIDSFDFGLIVSINIATYIIIKVISEWVNHKVNSWVKRIVMIICGIGISIFYVYTGDADYKLILNSLILTPVFWRWIGKPLVKHLGVDYKDSVYNG